jgi:two-component system, chemotaxis family, chemotaxis protein CheY
MMARIMVVDDSRLARTLVKNALMAAGFEVAGEAANGREATELYFKVKPDLVTMDVIMPDMDGPEAAKTILAQEPAAKIIMVTSLNQQSIEGEMLKAGAKAVLSKPFEPQALIASINAALAA